MMKCTEKAQCSTAVSSVHMASESRGCSLWAWLFEQSVKTFSITFFRLIRLSYDYTPTPLLQTLSHLDLIQFGLFGEYVYRCFIYYWSSPNNSEATQVRSGQIWGHTPEQRKADNSDNVYKLILKLMKSSTLHSSRIQCLLLPIIPLTTWLKDTFCYSSLRSGSTRLRMTHKDKPFDQQRWRPKFIIKHIRKH